MITKHIAPWCFIIFSLFLYFCTTKQTKYLYHVLLLLPTTSISTTHVISTQNSTRIQTNSPTIRKTQTIYPHINTKTGLENEDMTPTLRQLWTAIRQLQQDMTQIKQVINDEVALRVNLQQLLMQHLETGSTSSSNTPKC